MVLEMVGNMALHQSTRREPQQKRATPCGSDDKPWQVNIVPARATLNSHQKALGVRVDVNE